MYTKTCDLAEILLIKAPNLNLVPNLSTCQSNFGELASKDCPALNVISIVKQTEPGLVHLSLIALREMRYPMECCTRMERSVNLIQYPNARFQVDTDIILASDLTVSAPFQTHLLPQM